MNPNNIIYLDHASATPIDESVLKLMNSYDMNYFANASSIHIDGVKTREIIEKSREKIADGINAHADEIIFTGSSTESNALAILGTIKNYELRIKNKKLKYIIPHIITTKIEHPAVLENCKMLEERGEAEVTYLSVDKNGIVNPKDVKEAIKDNTILVSIMYANNEIGTIQPILEIAKNIRHYKKINKISKISTHDMGASFTSGAEIFPFFHTDATQAMNYLDTSNIEKLGVDLLSFNGSKIYGPKGVGVLYKKRAVSLVPLYKGGGQEFGLRSGTENISSISGLALAFEITNKIKNSEVVRLTKIRDYAINKLLLLSSKEYDIRLNGDKTARLPNNINISISSISSELLVLELDAKGIEVSSKSACKSSIDDDSYVIRSLREASSEMYKEEEGSLRITLGRDTKKADIDKLCLVLGKILNKYINWKK